MFALDERKLLSEGVHETTLAEVEETFGRFQRSDQRTRLFRKLLDYVKDVKFADCASSSSSTVVS